MRPMLLILPLLIPLIGCESQPSAPPANPPAAVAPAIAKPSLTNRRGFVTKPGGTQEHADPPPRPPKGVFELVKYDAPPASSSRLRHARPRRRQEAPGDRLDHRRRLQLDRRPLEDAPRDNDQTAAAYRKAGIVMMFPSLRGGNDNPGLHEGFLGEVDDVLAAADSSRSHPTSTPRIYLGGHSTGGTLVMLVAESTDRFRAVFSFGPADDVRGYPAEFIPFDTSNPRRSSCDRRAAGSTRSDSPLFVFEGTEAGQHRVVAGDGPGLDEPTVRFLPVKGATISASSPRRTTDRAKILGDDGPTRTSRSPRTSWPARATGEPPACRACLPFIIYEGGPSCSRRMSWRRNSPGSGHGSGSRTAGPATAGGRPGRLDVRNDGDGEYFEIAGRPNAEAKVEVLDVRRATGTCC